MQQEDTVGGYHGPTTGILGSWKLGVRGASVAHMQSATGLRKLRLWRGRGQRQSDRDNGRPMK
jgi:hypothetical protein